MNSGTKVSRWLFWRGSIFLYIMGFLQRMTIGAKAVLLDGDKVLLVKHSYMPGWHFPGGGVNHRETIEDGMAREVLEETGYRVTEIPPVFHTYLNTLPPQRDYVLVYVCRDFKKMHDFKANREIVDCQWYDRKALPIDTSPATQARIEEVFGERPKGRYWQENSALENRSTYE
jgi:8-oxo-dGTP pyrophosphatase MutT (NUDIX family)